MNGRSAPVGVVFYRLSESDAAVISEARRAANLGKGGSVNPRVGNVARSGQVYPALVVRDNAGGSVNLQVFLDGNDAHWVTSRARLAARSTGHGCWSERPEDFPE